MFELYEQPGFLTVSHLQPVRVGFNPVAFVARYNLRKIVQRGFYVNPTAASG